MTTSVSHSAKKEDTLLTFKVIIAEPVPVIHDQLKEMRYVLTTAERTKKDITNFLYTPQITDL